MSSRKFSTLHLQNVITTIIVIEVFTMSSELDQELIAKLEMADTRSENAEMDIGRLNVRIDKVEEDLDFLNEGDISSFFFYSDFCLFD